MTDADEITVKKTAGSNRTCFFAARTYVFFIYFLCSAVQGATWALIPSLPAVSAELFPGLLTSDLTWSMNANNIGQALAFPLATWILSQRMGLRWMMLMSFFTTFLQNALWAGIAIAAQTGNGVNLWAVRVCLIAGAFVGGIGASLIQGAPSQLSAVWFQPADRTRATAVAYSASFVGQTSSLLLDLGIDTASALTALLLGEFILLGVLTVVAFFYFPDSPENITSVCQFNCLRERHRKKEDTTNSALETNLLQPTSLDDTERDPAETDCRQLIKNVWRCLRNPHCAALLVSGAVLNGFYNSWQSALPIFLDSNSTGLGWNTSAAIGPAGASSIFEHTGASGESS